MEPGRLRPDQRVFDEIAQLVVDVAARAQACAAQRKIEKDELAEIQRVIQLALRLLEERKKS